RAGPSRRAASGPARMGASDTSELTLASPRAPANAAGGGLGASPAEIELAEVSGDVGLADVPTAIRPRAQAVVAGERDRERGGLFGGHAGERGDRRLDHALVQDRRRAAVRGGELAAGTGGDAVPQAAARLAAGVDEFLAERP